MTISDKSQDEPDLDLVVGFLCGTNALDGIWFGDKVIDRPTFWWRSRLRSAIAANNARVAAAVKELPWHSRNRSTSPERDDEYISKKAVLKLLDRPTATGTEGSK